MTTLPIVEHLDPLKDVLLGGFPRGVTLIVDEFFLQRAEEALDDRVVPAIALAAHGAGHLGVGEQSLVVAARVLHAAIRVVQQTGLGFSSRERHRQGVGGKIGGEPRAHRPADHRARVKIEHHRKIQPTRVGPEVGDIAGPDAVRRAHRKLPSERVGGHRQFVPGVGCGAPLLRGLGPNGVLMHQTRHALFVHPVAALDQGVPDARAAVGAPALGVDGSRGS